MSCALKTILLDVDRAIPRYTSYPTAPHFKTVDLCDSPYAIIPANTAVSLYIHIPFCPKLCWYCGCHTKITHRYDPVATYIDLLIREIALVEKTATDKISASHVHFGGGSPGILTGKDFTRVMDALRTAFAFTSKCEIAIEIDPREVTQSRVAAYAANGVTRISLGTQDFDQDVMRAVNREQPYELSATAMALFREHGIDNFNMDLIYGLPHQTTETMKATIDKVLTLSPNRISLFGYAHVPWMKKHMRLMDETALPDNDLRYDLFHTGAQMLEDAGYIPIGIDHFAKPDDLMALALTSGILRRNFQGYTTDQADTMIGLGLSSIGKTSHGFYQNHTDMPAYRTMIESECLPIARHCPLTEEDRIRGHIIERLMCDFAVDLAAYAVDFSESMRFLKPYQDRGLVIIDGTHILIPTHARLAARLICSAFDSYLAPETEKRHARAV